MPFFHFSGSLIAVDKGNSHRAFGDSGGASFHRPVTNIASGEHSGAAGFQVIRFAIQRPFLVPAYPALSSPKHHRNSLINKLENSLGHEIVYYG
jgi:hypothetical protein